MHKELNYIINHIFLPPKLPQKNDSEVTKSVALLEEVFAALRLFQDNVPELERSKWIPCTEMVSNMLELWDHVGGLEAEKVETMLRKMINGDILALHIRAQNAGLIVRRSLDQYSFESFEISPIMEVVIGTKGRLRRCFPGPAMTIGQDRVVDDGFLKPLAELLAKLDAEAPEEVWPIVTKARSKVVEIRDTVHPRFVTEMPTGILRAVGQPLDVPRIYKHTRDNVLWKEALEPRRRSPLWLFLRVALQMSLPHNDEDAHVRYKYFMLFLMTYVLEGALEALLPSDILFFMTAKISCRALKLGAVNGAAWWEYVETTVKTVQQELIHRWDLVQKDPDPLRTQRSWLPLQPSFLQDTKLKLPRLRPYLEKVSARPALGSTSHSSISDCGRRVSQYSLNLPDLSPLTGMDASSAHLYLADLELWVRDSLNDWLCANMECQDAYIGLAKVIDTYTSAASSIYAEMPEDISLMLLTSIDLWVALNKQTLHHYPLLQDYDPEFPPSLFEPLLLPKKPQMEQISCVERYLTKRRKAARPGYPSIFSSIDTCNSFAVRCYQHSPHHQELRRIIEGEAQIERAQKLSELEKKKQEYHKLIQQSNALSCQFVLVWKSRQYVSKHSDSCQKCQLKSNAKNLHIGVHEWPLPSKDLQAKTAVFELDVPTGISQWRDTTYTLLIDMLSVEPNARSLPPDKGKEPVDDSSSHRKQNLVISHYRYQKVSQASETSVCVNNGLNYRVYDSKKARWTEELLGHCDVREQCTLVLPAGPYTGLQYTVTNTIHTSNEVIARQADCPAELTTHEFYAFGTLRSGHRLQWRNIARELATRVLNLSCQETHILVTQAAWQAGPLGKGEVCRESHIDLKEEEFGKSLLSVLEDAVSSIEGNWQGAAAARTFVVITGRPFSLSTSDKVCAGCSRFLRRARAISLRWTRELGRRLQEGQKEEELKSLSARALEMALTCHGTFDVDLHHLPYLLKSDEDIAIVIECSIVVHDRCPAVIGDLPASTKTLLRRYSRVSYLLEPFLRKWILKACGGLNSAVSQLWVGYKPGSPWTALNMPNERWLVTETSCEGGLSSMLVHYSLLNGSLLVNGSPLTRLPRSYESHPTFRRLFGQKVLDVVPSTISGMPFEARSTFFEHQLCFGMYDSELIIRARKLGRVYELLPLHALNGDFPRAFVQDYAHWLDVDTGYVEWRPLSNAWTRRLQNWEMRSDSDREDLLICGSSRLIDLHTPTAKAVSTILSPLEHTTHMHITLNCETEILEVHLPRLKLDFFLRKGALQLESKQFHGMTVDANQSCGTLTGLIDKLVLCGNSDPLRSVIIPHGDVRFQPEGHHVHVKIDTPTKHVSYYHYIIDDKIGRLVDNGSFISKLFKCYLHAVTAHCLTDELTGRTGTEEALYTLASPSVRSFFRLEQIEVNLLELIARLTPRRQYYPEHLRVMQQVEWETLSPLSQHHSFCELVQSIFEHGRTLGLFHEEPPQLPDAGIRGNQHLLKRATIRDSTFRVHGFGAENHTPDHDVVYFARDNTSNSIRESQVYHIANLVDHWSTNMRGCLRLLHEIESWEQPLCGYSIESACILGYDIKWLDPLAEFLPSDWCTLQTTLSHSVVGRDKYRVMMFLSTLAYSQHAKQDLVQTLLAFATVPQLRAIRPPDDTSFRLSHGYKPSKEILVDASRIWCRPYQSCSEINLPPFSYESPANVDRRRRDEHQVAVEKCLSAFVDDLISQWPDTNVCSLTGSYFDTYISVKEATEDARIYFKSWYRNTMFKESIGRTQHVLDRLDAGDQTLVCYSFSQPRYHYCPKWSHVELNDIMERSAPSLSPPPLPDFDSWVGKQDIDQRDRSKLESLLVRLASESSGSFMQQYAVDLRKSFDSFHSKADAKLSRSPTSLKPLLREYLKLCKKHVDDVYHTICHRLQAETSITQRLAYESKMWPRLSTTSLLQQLGGGRAASLREGWKASLIEYGLAISMQQRAERLLGCIENNSDLLSELSNPGHQGWDPAHYPDWILLEIESNILIRPAQLNMGEGKSSVIIPIVAAALADRKKLVRVLVLKSLFIQMFHILLSKLGGMVGRRIFHMPILRSIRLNEHKARQIRNLCEECMYTGGILLIQPEHLLSFELMGLDRVLSGESELGSILTETQLWLESHSRDILDESDEILSVRSELIYTMGVQRAIEFGPDRWTITQHVLGLVSRCADSVLKIIPHGLEIGPLCPGSFPRMVAREVCETGLPGVPVWNLPKHVRAAIFRFLTDFNVSKADTESLQPHVLGADSIERGLLLLRGLIAGGVLAFALQRRWRVNYGLDLWRTMLAVPYRAKNNPATRAEFSHPDVTIVLTCLSYYYGGLSDEQLCTAFEKLYRSDHAQEEYDYWLHDAPKLPSAFRRLDSINLRDRAQFSQMVFPLLRLAKGAIDFYISHIVFPKEMKEFPNKLSSSGWDIARTRVHPTTGFSGTNDSRYILPLSISQCDLPPQLHTNAEVLDCLLRPENSFKHVMQESGRENLDAESLLKIVIWPEPPVRVILDVGAQVLEWKNEEVARRWLSQVPVSEAQAVVFFNDRNDLSVLSRDGMTESLMISPFAKRMDQCLVYLDEAHTRGTDLKLPANYRAAVTLGPDLTKDRLVQACMRMRRLGKGQSVMFCAPLEIERKILHCSGKSLYDIIEVADVLRWSISETCTNMRKCVPLWAIQGMRHQRRHIAGLKSSTSEQGGSALNVAESLLEAEAQSLRDRYGSREQRTEEEVLPHNLKGKSFSNHETQLEAIRAKCREFELTSMNDSTLQEEQERELSPENEQEQQVERPLALPPYSHSVHQDVKRFIHRGVLNRRSNAFQPAFELFGITSAIDCLEAEAWPADLLVTTDFARSVRSPKNQLLDSFLRPVHWVLSGKDRNAANCVALSPYEAHELLPFILQHKNVTLHVYSARVSMSMHILEGLSFCAVSAVPKYQLCPSLVMQLNLFAGGLYLNSYKEYLSVCRFLGLYFRPPDEQVQVACDGFICPTSRPKFDETTGRECPFTASPVGFLRILMTLRRKGQSFEMSHFGRILRGELLTKEQF